MTSKLVFIAALFLLSIHAAEACKQPAVNFQTEQFKSALETLMSELKGPQLSETQLNSIYFKDRLVVVETNNAKGVCSARAYEAKTETDCKVTSAQVRLLLKCKGQ